MESKKLTGIPALSYEGVEALTPPDLIIQDDSPTVNDFENINIGTLWLVPSADQIGDPTDAEIWMLCDIVGLVATWVQIYPGMGGAVGATQFITDNGVANQAGGILNVPGDPNITTSGAGNTVTIDLNSSITITGPLTVSSLGAGVVQTDAGGLFFSDNGTNGQVLIGGGTEPNWANITAGANVTITNGPNSITIASTSSTSGATIFHTDSGTANTVANAITIAGGSNIGTTGAGSTVTVNLDNSVSVPGSLTAGTTVTATTGLTVSSFGAGVVQTNASGVFTSNKGLNGQTLISSTAGVPAWANLTSTGGTVTITNGPNTINLEAAASPPPPGSLTAWNSTYINPSPPYRSILPLNSGAFLGRAADSLRFEIPFFNLDGNFFRGGATTVATYTAPVTGIYFLASQLSFHSTSATNYPTVFNFSYSTTLFGSPVVYSRSLEVQGWNGAGGPFAPSDRITKAQSLEILIPLDAGAVVQFFVRAFSEGTGTAGGMTYFLRGYQTTANINIWLSGFRVA